MSLKKYFWTAHYAASTLHDSDFHESLSWRIESFDRKSSCSTLLFHKYLNRDSTVGLTSRALWKAETLNSVSFVGDECGKEFYNISAISKCVINVEVSITVNQQAFVSCVWYDCKDESSKTIIVLEPTRSAYEHRNRIADSHEKTHIIVFKRFRFWKNIFYSFRLMVQNECANKFAKRSSQPMVFWATVESKFRARRPARKMFLTWRC